MRWNASSRKALDLMQRRGLLLALSALGVACGPKPLSAPPSAPAVVSAADLIPADLDVVVRFDLGRVKAALGATVLAALSREVLSAAGGSEHSDALVLESLLSADMVFLGYRPSPILAPLDRVLALQGSFEQLARPPLGFANAVDLGGDVRYFDRRSSTSLARGAVARIYSASTRVRAFVSEAEIDAVERVLATGGAERQLSPPEEGTLSLAARPWLVTRFGGRGALRDLLDSARALHAVADLESDGVRLELALELAKPEQAEALAAAARPVLQRLGGALAARGELKAEGTRLVLEARLERAQLLPLLGCLRGGSGSDCAW
jgi:hypothetical protein